MARAIFRCGNKKCGKSWARDYPVNNRVSLGYGRFENRASRVNEHGRLVWWREDTRCPDCGGSPRKLGLVQGHVSGHRCGPKCTDAVGFLCECACGGANHGAGFLVCNSAEAT